MQVCKNCGCEEHHHYDGYAECSNCNEDCYEFIKGGSTAQFVEQQLETALGALNEVQDVMKSEGHSLDAHFLNAKANVEELKEVCQNLLE